MDREAQRRNDHYSGVRGIAIQDSSLQESMGPIVDRTKERLVATDSGIIKARQKLRKAAIALAEEGVAPPGIDPAHQQVRSVAIVLPQDASFLESTAEAAKVRRGTPQTSV
jgi:phthalate 4,5-dioxygenase oxygenase subunit